MKLLTFETENIVSMGNLLRSEICNLEFLKWSEFHLEFEVANKIQGDNEECHRNWAWQEKWLKISYVIKLRERLEELQKPSEEGSQRRLENGHGSEKHWKDSGSSGRLHFLFLHTFEALFFFFKVTLSPHSLSLSPSLDQL